MHQLSKWGPCRLLTPFKFSVSMEWGGRVQTLARGRRTQLHWMSPCCQTSESAVCPAYGVGWDKSPLRKLLEKGAGLLQAGKLSRGKDSLLPCSQGRLARPKHPGRGRRQAERPLPVLTTPQNSWDPFRPSLSSHSTPWAS